MSYESGRERERFRALLRDAEEEDFRRLHPDRGESANTTGSSSRQAERDSHREHTRGTQPHATLAAVDGNTPGTNVLDRVRATMHADHSDWLNGAASRHLEKARDEYERRRGCGRRPIR